MLAAKLWYLGLALRGEVLLDKQGAQSHPKVFVGLSQAEPAQVQLLLRAVDLPGELVDGAAESRRQVFAESRHDAPQHVVMEDPKKKPVPYSLNWTGFDWSDRFSGLFQNPRFSPIYTKENKLVNPVICWCGSDVNRVCK